MPVNPSAEAGPIGRVSWKALDNYRNYLAVTNSAISREDIVAPTYGDANQEPSQPQSTKGRDKSDGTLLMNPANNAASCGVYWGRRLRKCNGWWILVDTGDSFKGRKPTSN